MPIDKKKRPAGGETKQTNSKNPSTDNIAENKPKSKGEGQKNTDSGRYRNFGCVVYPESAPDGWEDILAEQKIPAFISPLHDRDIDPQQQPKKQHYHVMVMFEGKKSTDQVKKIFEQIGGVGCEVVNSIRGYARYLCHLDNPEKAQYNVDDVRRLGGADYTAIIGLVSDKYKAIRDMRAWCKDNNIVSYADLFDYAAECNEGWFRVLCDCGTVVMKEYLKSREWQSRQPPRETPWRVDLSTGEVIDDKAVADDDM